MQCSTVTLTASEHEKRLRAISSRTHLCCRKIRATTTCTEQGHVRHSEVSDCDTHGRHVGIDAHRCMAEFIDSSLKLRLNGAREQHLQPLSYAYIHKLWQLRLCDEKVSRGMTTSFRFLSKCSQMVKHLEGEGSLISLLSRSYAFPLSFVK